MKFYVTDGTSLSAILDSSIGFLFSFDSLVHAEQEVIAGVPVAACAETESRWRLSTIPISGLIRGRLAVLDHYFKLPPSFRRRVLTMDTISRLLSSSLQASLARSMTRPYSSNTACTPDLITFISLETLALLRVR